MLHSIQGGDFRPSALPRYPWNYGKQSEGSTFRRPMTPEQTGADHTAPGDKIAFPFSVIVIRSLLSCDR
jgi:hypothetical protein